MEHNNIKHGLEALALGTVFGTVAGMLPSIVAIFALIWYVLQFITWFKHEFGKRKTKTRRYTDRQ